MAQLFLSSMLPRRGPDAFRKFITALVICKQQQFIAKELDPEMARAVASDTGVDNTDAARCYSQSLESDEEIIEKMKGCMRLPCHSLCFKGHLFRSTRVRLHSH